MSLVSFVISLAALAVSVTFAVVEFRAWQQVKRERRRR